MNNYLLIIFIIYLFSSCDTPGKLLIENKSKDTAIFRCEFSERDSIYEVKLGPAKNENKVIIFFGFGNLWTDERIKEYVSSIKKIEIFSVSDSIILSEYGEKYNFFKNRRKGVLKDEIRIVIR